MKHFNYCGLLFAIGLIALSPALLAQTPSANSGYDAGAALKRAQVLRQNPRARSGSLEIENLCNNALANQDGATLINLVGINEGNVLMQVLQGMSDLPTPMKKQILVAVLQNDPVWNYVRSRNYTDSGFKEGQYNRQQTVRMLTSKVLGRNLELTSKHYDPDRFKQRRAEVSDPEASIIDPATREKLVQELSH